MEKSSSRSQPPSRQRWNGQEHSNEVENRLTRLELSDESQQDINEQTESRLTWHERALQGLALSVWLLIQGKASDVVPSLAEFVAAILQGMLR